MVQRSKDAPEGLPLPLVGPCALYRQTGTVPQRPVPPREWCARRVPHGPAASLPRRLGAAACPGRARFSHLPAAAGPALRPAVRAGGTVWRPMHAAPRPLLPVPSPGPPFPVHRFASLAPHPPFPVRLSPSAARRPMLPVRDSTSPPSLLDRATSGHSFHASGPHGPPPPRSARRPRLVRTAPSGPVEGAKTGKAGRPHDADRFLFCSRDGHRDPPCPSTPRTTTSSWPDP